MLVIAPIRLKVQTTRAYAKNDFLKFVNLGQDIAQSAVQESFNDLHIQAVIVDKNSPNLLARIVLLPWLVLSYQDEKALVFKYVKSV